MIEQKSLTQEELKTAWDEAAVKEKTRLQETGYAQPLRELSKAVDALAEMGLDIRVEILSGLSTDGRRNWDANNRCPLFGFIHLDGQPYLFALVYEWHDVMDLKLAEAPLPKGAELPHRLADAGLWSHLGDLNKDGGVIAGFQKRLIARAANHVAVRECDVAGRLFPVANDLKKPVVTRKATQP